MARGLFEQHLMREAIRLLSNQMAISGLFVPHRPERRSGKGAAPAHDRNQHAANGHRSDRVALGVDESIGTGTVDRVPCGDEIIMGVLVRGQEGVRIAHVHVVLEHPSVSDVV